MNPTSLYLAGPMRGLPRYNFPSFVEARTRLRNAGHMILCPAERNEQRGFDPTGMTGNEDLAALGFDLSGTLAQCFTDVMSTDGVALLPGWARSEGARAEALIALLTGKPIYAYLKHRPASLELLESVRVSTRVEADR